MELSALIAVINIDEVIISHGFVIVAYAQVLALILEFLSYGGLIDRCDRNWWLLDLRWVLRSLLLEVDPGHELMVIELLKLFANEAWEFGLVLIFFVWMNEISNRAFRNML